MEELTFDDMAGLDGGSWGTAFLCGAGVAALGMSFLGSPLATAQTAGYLVKAGIAGACADAFFDYFL